MNSYILSTDSGCDLTLATAQELDVHVLRMQYEIDGQSYTETMHEEDLAVFYQKMKDGAQAHTTAINIEDYISFWKQLLDAGKPIVHISLGSGISSSYQNAVNARSLLLEAYPDAQIYVIDSLGACMSYGLLVIDAARLRDEGVTPDECVRQIEAKRLSCNAIYTTGDLEYLYRGGRVSRAGAIISKTLNIWPILNLNDKGELRVIDKCRGRTRAYRRVAEMIHELAIAPEKQTLYLCHSNAPEAVEAYKAAILALTPFRDVFISQIGTTIGAHTGPGLVTAFYYGKDRQPDK
ncbi:MAG: DegV family protein [Oscillospiraceae bacterium]|nr:DegV family protein [Oscillospiraceae bacterium]